MAVIWNFRNESAANSRLSEHFAAMLAGVRIRGLFTLLKRGRSRSGDISKHALRQADAPQQVRESRVRAQDVEHRLHFEKREDDIALVVCLIEKHECLIFFAKRRINDGQYTGRDISAF